MADCSICLSALAGQSVLQLPECGHEFHGTCAARWFRLGNQDCPLCRRCPTETVSSEDESEEDGLDAIRRMPLREISSLVTWRTRRSMNATTVIQRAADRARVLLVRVKERTGDARRHRASFANLRRAQARLDRAVEVAEERLVASVDALMRL